MSILLRFAAILLIGCGITAAGLAQNEEQKTGVLIHEEQALDGYTFIAPLINSSAYAIDNQGRVVQQWDFGGRTREIHLLDNGNLMVVHAPRDEIDESLYDLGYPPDGAVAEYTWDGELLWERSFTSAERRHHHGIDILPNGNVLALLWDYYPLDDAIAKGLSPAIVAASFEEEEVFLPDVVVEIDNPSGEIVWEWRPWDHLIQNLDQDLPDFGLISGNPQRIDINYEQYYLKGIPLKWSAGPADWMHSNSVNYNPDLDQIVISVLRFDEMWIIDHRHSTADSAGPAGDLLYRWGNPFAYGKGRKAEDRRLFQQHDIQWIDAGLPGAGNIILYNNRNNVIREDAIAEDEYSSILELKLPLLEDGSYDWNADVEIVWQYDRGFYSQIISGVQRLPNGNTLITAGVPGQLIEVTPEGRVVWEYINPINSESRWLFRVRKYAADHPGLAGKDLEPGAILVDTTEDE